MIVSIERAPGLLGDWKQGALNEKNIEHAVTFLSAFRSMPDNEAAPIFGPYLQGLLMLSKSDIHLFCYDQARNSFLQSLASALGHFGDWDGQANSFRPSLHCAFESIMPEEPHRNQVFEVIDPKYRSKDGPFGDAIEAKRIADLYLVMVAYRVMERRMNAARTANPTSDQSEAPAAAPPTGATR